VDADAPAAVAHPLTGRGAGRVAVRRVAAGSGVRVGQHSLRR
jgi:hypothetical protein